MVRARRGWKGLEGSGDGGGDGGSERVGEHGGGHGGSAGGYERPIRIAPLTTKQNETQSSVFIIKKIARASFFLPFLFMPLFIHFSLSLSFSHSFFFLSLRPVLFFSSALLPRSCVLHLFLFLFLGREDVPDREVEFNKRINTRRL